MFTKEDLHYKDPVSGTIGISHRALARALGLGQEYVAHLIRRGEWAHFEVKVPTSVDDRRRGRHTIHVCLSGLDAYAFLLERGLGPMHPTVCAVHDVFKPAAPTKPIPNGVYEAEGYGWPVSLHNQALLYKQQVDELETRLELQTKVIARLQRELRKEQDLMRKLRTGDAFSLQRALDDRDRCQRSTDEARAQVLRLQAEVDDLRRQLEHPELRAGAAKPAYLPGFKATGRYARIAWLSYQATDNLYTTKFTTREGHASALLRELGLLDHNGKPTALGMRHSKLDGTLRVWEQGLGPLVRELAEERLAS